MSIFQIIGVAGFFTYLASFAALQAKLIDGNGYLYAIGNGDRKCNRRIVSSDLVDRGV